MKTPLQRTLRYAAVVLAVLAGACLDDRAVAPEPDAAAPVRLALKANIIGAAAGQTVRIRTFYRRVDGTDVTLESTPNEVDVTPGVPQTVAIQVRVTRCLADEQRAGADERACQIGVELALLDEGGTVIDQQSTPPSQPAVPGSSVTIGEPITLADVGEVAVGSVPALRVGDSRTLTATATDGSGNALSRTFTWASDNPGVLSVNATTGAATAVAAGSARVTATTGLKSGAATVRVIRRVVSVTLSPDPAPTLQAAATLTFSAVPKDASGADAGDLADRTITWTTANPAGTTRTASVSTNGIVTGVFPGDADVTVSIDGITKTTRVRVTAGGIRITPGAGQLLVGGTLPLQGTAVDANGVELAGVPLTWSSSDNAVATVSSAGLVTAVAAGQATITATGGGVDANVLITVGTLVLGVSPSNSTVLAGNTLPLTVTGALGPVTWQTSNATVATVSTTGVITALYPGRVTMTATTSTAAGTQRGSAFIDVTAGSLEIRPEDAIMYESETLQFSAVARDTKGNVLTGLAVTWASGNPQLAPINSGGVVFGSGATTTTITAFAGGLSAVASLRILNFSETFRPQRPKSDGGIAPPRTTGTPSGN